LTAGTASVAYSRFGNNTTGHGLSAASDLLLSGKLEVDGQSFFDGGASYSSDFELTGASSMLGINSGGSTTARLEIGDSTTTGNNVASISATGLTSGDAL